MVRRRTFTAVFNARWRRRRWVRTTLDQRPANRQFGENIASRSPSVITFPPHVA